MPKTPQTRVAVVTGGSRGIGRAAALALSGPGVSVVITHSNPQSPGVAETLEAIEARGADLAEAQVWNAADPEEGKRRLVDISERLGSLDILVNNAGITRDAISLRMTDEDFREVLEVDLFSVFSLSRTAGAVMLKQKSGRIINVSSVVAFTGNPGQANYAAAKAGVVGLTKTLALEYASRGVTVNAVAPGFIHTDMTKNLSGKIKDALLARVPLGRMGDPEDVAAAVAFLASPGAAYVTGQTIHVNGGLYL
ncbi:MAG: 3-oxoacyl-[acyl-carrier-protein] reductase [Deltaproteobacteria bacterium]|jgi:3-oxoacyl-[acyl-carrier protein] reductase|nr:3-oxoacyl-[acyl-carrier-protein] reductase [Deltaproteobacteria bacterium]